MSIGQRYSILVKLDQTPGEYLLRFAAYPWGDMQKVIEDAAVMQYDVSDRFLTATEGANTRGRTAPCLLHTHSS